MRRHAKRKFKFALYCLRLYLVYLAYFRIWGIYVKCKTRQLLINIVSNLIYIILIIMVVLYYFFFIAYQLLYTFFVCCKITTIFRPNSMQITYHVYKGQIATKTNTFWLANNAKLAPISCLIFAYSINNCCILQLIQYEYFLNLNTCYLIFTVTWTKTIGF